MKKSKLLIPLLTIGGTAAAVTPIMTSCTQGEKEETHFQFKTGEKNINVQETVGYWRYDFTTTEQWTEEQVKLISPVAICDSNNPSGISLLRCYLSVSSDRKQFTVQIDYSVDPSAFTEAGTVFNYDIKLHNGTWYQTETGFSITAKKQ